MSCRVAFRRHASESPPGKREGGASSAAVAQAMGNTCFAGVLRGRGVEEGVHGGVDGGPPALLGLQGPCRLSELVLVVLVLQVAVLFLIFLDIFVIILLIFTAALGAWLGSRRRSPGYD